MHWFRFIVLYPSYFFPASTLRKWIRKFTEQMTKFQKDSWFASWVLFHKAQVGLYIYIHIYKYGTWWLCLVEDTDTIFLSALIVIFHKTIPCFDGFFPVALSVIYTQHHQLQHNIQNTMSPNSNGQKNVWGYNVLQAW